MTSTRYSGLAPVLLLLSAPAIAAEPFSLIVVPDTQNYTDFSTTNTEYNVGQMNWIVANKATKNIKFVMHMGDMQNPGNPYRTQAGNIYEPDISRPTDPDPDVVQSIITKWNRADAAIDVLDAGGVPYSLVPGNHDYLDHNTKTEPYLYLKRFGPTRYTNNPKFDEKGLQTYGGASPASPTFDWAGMNTYHRFNAGGYRFLNIALQFAPDTNDLAWAQKIINENPGLPTIITTHSYVNTIPAASDYQRPIIWDRLVKNNPQVVMTFNGHLTGAHHVNGTNIAGKPVHQFLVDFQASQLDDVIDDDPKTDYYRGAGVLRTVTIDTDRSRVDLQDYSPIAKKNMPMGELYTALDNDGDVARYNTPASVNIDWAGRFGLQNKGGITRTQTLRDGVNGYDATTDTWIDANDAPATHGADATAWVDGNRANGNPSQALIRFDLFGAGSIPRGSMIDSATLVLHTSELSNSQSPHGMAIHRLLETFDNDTAWSTNNGTSLDGLEAILAASGTVFPTAQGMFVTFDVTESIGAWSAGATNHGWVIDALGGDGWQFDTSEHANVNFRPQLNVMYRVVPEPGSLAVVGCAALVMLARRRRPARA